MAKKDTTQTAEAEEAGQYDFDFHQWPFYWIATVDRSYQSIMEKALAHIGLDIPSWRVLMILHSMRSASVSEISNHSVVKLSTMTKIIQRMQNDGLVTSSPSEQDRRVTVVTITEKGEKVGREGFNESVKIVERVFSDFTDVEQQILLTLLTKLQGTLKRY